MQCLKIHVSFYSGIPEVSNADRGTQLESELIQQLCDLWVERTQTTPYHQQSKWYVKQTRGECTSQTASQTVSTKWIATQPIVQTVDYI